MAIEIYLDDFLADLKTAGIDVGQLNIQEKLEVDYDFILTNDEYNKDKNFRIHTNKNASEPFNGSLAFLFIL